MGHVDSDGVFQDASTKCCSCGAPAHSCEGSNDHELWCNGCESDETFTDSYGDNCAAYDSSPGWCADAYAYAVNGIDASMVCCVCGGGSPGYCHVAGSHRLWESTSGKKCRDLVTSYTCLDGELGPGAAAQDVDSFSDLVDDDGSTADKKCCECMLPGSSEYSYHGCTVAGKASEWKDKNGNMCSDYVSNGWCKGKYDENCLLLIFSSLCCQNMIIV